MAILDFMMIAMIIIALALIVVVLVQGHTNSGIGSVFGGTDIYRTRRGMEKTLFNVTFLLAGIFFVLALVTVAIG